MESVDDEELDEAVDDEELDEAVDDDELEDSVDDDELEDSVDDEDEDVASSCCCCWSEISAKSSSNVGCAPMCAGWLEMNATEERFQSTTPHVTKRHASMSPMPSSSRLCLSNMVQP